MSVAVRLPTCLLTLWFPRCTPSLAFPTHTHTHTLEDVLMPEEVEKELEEKLADLYAPLHPHLAALDAQEQFLASSLAILWFREI